MTTKKVTFKKLEGHTSLISAVAIGVLHMQLVKDIIALYGRPVVSRKELKSAHLELRNRKASPYFIAKNKAIQVTNAPGRYDLSRFKLAKSEIKNAIEAAATPEPTTDTPVIVPSAKKERKSKKEKMTLTSRAKSRTTRRKEIAAPTVETPVADATTEPLESAVPETI